MKRAISLILINNYIGSILITQI